MISVLQKLLNDDLEEKRVCRARWARMTRIQSRALWLLIGMLTRVMPGSRVTLWCDVLYLPKAVGPQSDQTLSDARHFAQ